MLLLGSLLTDAGLVVQQIWPTVWLILAHTLASAEVKFLVHWTVVVRAYTSTPFNGPYLLRRTRQRVAGWDADCWWGRSWRWSCEWGRRTAYAFTLCPVPQFSNFAWFWAA